MRPFPHWIGTSRLRFLLGSLLLFVAALSPASAQQPAYLTNGLVAYYPFNGNANDESGNGNNFDSTGSVFVADRFNRPNRAYGFSGALAKKTTSEFIPGAGHSKTISFWIFRKAKPYSDEFDERYLSFGNGVVNFRVRHDPPWNSQILPDLFTVDIPSSSGRFIDARGNFFGKWTHCVYVFEGDGFIRFYLNGIRSAWFYDSNPQDKLLGVGKSALVLGAPWMGFNGFLDQIRIYDRVLAENEIMGLYEYDSELRVDDSIRDGLIVEYLFDGNTRDSSGVGIEALGFGLPKYNTNRFGRINKSIRFDKFDQYVRANLIGFPEMSGEKTFSFWYQADFSALGSSGQRASELFALGKSDSWTNSLVSHLYFSGLIGMTYLTTFQAWGDGFVSYYFNQTPEWNHVVVKYLNPSLFLYLNGTLVDSRSVDLKTSGSELRVGAGFWKGEQFFGSIDDFRIHNRALSTDEISAIYEAERVPDTVITSQPQGGITVRGAGVTLGVTASNPSPLVTLSYQWQKDGNPLPGATNATLSIANVQPVNIGDYRVVVSGGFAPVTSSVASIEIEGVNSGAWKGLVAWYPFSGSFADAAQSGIAANADDIEFSMDRYGKAGKAASFGRTGKSVVRVPESQVPVGNSPRTFSIWLKTDGGFLQRDGGPTGTASIIVYGSPQPSVAPRDWSQAISDGVPENWGALNMGSTLKDGVTIGRWKSGTGRFVDGSWHHWVVSYDGVGQLLFYLDGRLLPWGDGTFVPPLDTAPSELRLGNTPTGSYPYNGLMDDFRIYNRALSPGDITALYESERVPDTVIGTQPQGLTAVAGSDMTLTVTASNPSPFVTLTYQWQKDGNALPGETNAVLRIASVQPVNIGDYRVVVSGGFAPIISNVANVGIEGVNSGVWKGLVGYYTWRGGATSDQSGNKNHLESIGDVRFSSDRFGVGNNAARFDRDRYSGFLLASYNGFGHDSDSEMTITGWFRNDPSKDVEIAWGEDRNFYVSDFLINLWNQKNELGLIAVGVVFNFDLKYNKFSIHVPTVAGRWDSAEIGRGDFYSRWSQFAVTHGAKTRKIYVDGVLKFTGSNAPPILMDKSQKLFFGVSPFFLNSDRSDHRMNGSMGEIRFYNRALSDADVAALYESERVPDTVITRQPQSVTVAVGGSVQLSIEASNPIPTVPLAYQWFKDGAQLPGATKATLDLGTLQLEEVGAYTVTVDDGSRTITSAVATVNLQGVDPAIWKGLVASYPLDGSYRDVSGFGDELVPYGQVDWVPVGHRPESGAARVRGLDGFLVGPERTWFSGKAPRTVSVWFKPDGTSANPSTLLNLGGLEACGQRFALQVPAAQNGLRFDGGDCTNGLRSRTFTGGSVAGKWTHAVLTYDGSSVRAYVNGLASGSAYAVELATDAAAPLVLGNMVGVDTEGFSGWLDDVRVYNRALTSTEVRSLYTFENSGTTPSLPQITRQPQAVQGYEGETLRLSVEASGFQLGYQWQRDGQNLAADSRVQGVGAAELVIRGAVVSDSGDYRVMVTNVFGTATSAVVRVSVEPPIRVLAAGTATEVQEGSRLTFPLSLSSPGDVGGLTFKLVYDAAFLAEPQLEWSAGVGQSVNSVNVGTPGEISAAFSLAGQALASGTNPVASVSFRARSVPGLTNVVLAPVIVSAGSPTGAILANGNGAIPGEGRVLPRKIRGDNNANQRIDIGDAVVISRLQVGLEPVRPWDVPLNDLNDTGSIDNGDVIKALRIVVGLDLQPKAAARSGGELSVESGVLRVEGPAAAGAAPGPYSGQEEAEPGVGWALARPVPQSTAAPTGASPSEAGLNPQLSALHSQPARSLRLAGSNTNDVATLEFPDGPIAQVGKPYRVVVKLTRAGAAIAGLSFTVNYPSALTLTDKQVGALVPSDALPLWAESAGSVNLAAVRSTIWPASTGVAAVLTFLPTAGIAAQATWPIELVKGEVTGAGFDIRALDTVAGEIRSTSTPPVEPKVVVPTLPTDGGPLALDVEAAVGAAIVLETTTDLSAWSEAQRLTGQGAGKPVRVTVTPDPNARVRFWRVRVP